ncbi:MAG: cysteine hydrolase [Calditerrivibrio sp.]|nr:cysteine hydrolase [Calditerrivibrio sp.]
MKKIFMLFLLIFLVRGNLFSADIITEWDWVTPQPQPTINKAIVDNETALLILDIEQLTCNKERRPRCLDTLEPISNILKKFKKNGLFVVYSLTPNGKPENILNEVKPNGDEPIVSSTVNKFLNTKLDYYLKGKGIKKLVITGTAASGAVLFTATEAAQRGYNIIIPVDGMSDELFSEQAVLHILLNGPGTKNKVIITKSDMIYF